MSIHTSAWSRTRILRGGITATAFLLLVSSITLLAPAEDPPVIVSFSGNGWLAWTNAPGVHGFAVQWASHPSGPWSNNWHGLDNIVTTNTSTMVSVPMFYRVSQSFTPADMRSAWMIVDQSHGHNHFIALEDGIISESSFFIPRRLQDTLPLGRRAWSISPSSPTKKRSKCAAASRTATISC
jgi:hypothetical protein